VPLNHHAILHPVAYLVTAGVAAAELLELPIGHRFAWTAALLAAFAVVLVALLRSQHRRSKMGFLALALAESAIVIGIVVLGASPTTGVGLIFLLCAIVGMQLSVGTTIAWVIGANVVLLVCLILSGDRTWFLTLLGNDLGFIAIVAFVVAFRLSLQARAESQQLLAELTSAQSRLRDLAVTEERRRLAREMHDAVGHRLTAAAVLLEGAGRLIQSDPARATQMVETSRTQVRQGLDELRAAVSALHAESPGLQSLSKVLSALVEVFAQGAESNVTLEVQPGMAEPDPERKLVIIRTAQEALTNVQKHAAATRVEITLRAEDDAYVLECRDNGRGIADTGPGGIGFGLRNLRTRAAPFDGHVELESLPDGGAVLRLILPSDSEASHV
jgi:signal transduction histidine kinase